MLTKLKEVSLLLLLRRLPIRQVAALTGHDKEVEPVPLFVNAVRGGHDLDSAVPVETELRR